MTSSFHRFVWIILWWFGHKGTRLFLSLFLWLLSRWWTSTTLSKPHKIHDLGQFLKQIVRYCLYRSSLFRNEAKKVFEQECEQVVFSRLWPCLVWNKVPHTGHGFSITRYLRLYWLQPIMAFEVKMVNGLRLYPFVITRLLDYANRHPCQSFPIYPHSHECR